MIYRAFLKSWVAERKNISATRPLVYTLLRLVFGSEWVFLFFFHLFIHAFKPHPLARLAPIFIHIISLPSSNTLGRLIVALRCAFRSQSTQSTISTDSLPSALLSSPPLSPKNS